MSLSFVYIGNTRAGAELTESLVAAGFKAAPDIESAQVVITYCTNQEELENVYFDTGGVIARATEGTYLVDLSATTPAFGKEISAMATVSNLHAIEAPLVVRDATAAHAYNAQNLVALVAAEDEPLAAVEPLLKALAGEVIPCGATGSAQLARCATTIARASSMVAAAEVTALLRQVDPAHQQQIATCVKAAVTAETDALVAAAQDFNHESSYCIEVISGEIEAVIDAADEVGLVLPQLESCEYLLRMLELIDGGHMSAPAISLLYLEEPAAAKHGLDWTRAEQMYAQMDQAAHHHHHHHDDDDDDYDIDHLDFGSEFGFGYSPN